MENLTLVLENVSTDSPGTKGAHQSRNALAYVHFVIGTYIFTANTLVIVAVANHHNLRTRANMYIVSLAGTDLTVGIVEWIIGFHNHDILASYFDRTGYACVGMFSFAFFSVDCSMFNMVLIAVDRLVYIMKPFFYSRVVTSKRVKMTILSVWVLAFLWASVPVFANTYDEQIAQCTMQNSIPTWFRSYINVPILFTGATSTGIIYIAIAVKALQHKSAICKSIPGMGATSVVSSDAAESAKQALHTLRSNLKTLKLFCIVFGLLVICWVPYYFIEFSSDFVEIPDAYYRASAALGFLNSGINFFVYPLYNKKFRRAMGSMLCPCCKQSRSSFLDTTSTCVSKAQSSGPPVSYPVPPTPVLGHTAPETTPESAPITTAAPPTSDLPVTTSSGLTTNQPPSEKQSVLSTTVPGFGEEKAASVQGLTETDNTVSSASPAAVSSASPVTVSSTTVPSTLPATVPSATVPSATVPSATVPSTTVPSTLPATVRPTLPEPLSSGDGSVHSSAASTDSTLRRFGQGLPGTSLTSSGSSTSSSI